MTDDYYFVILILQGKNKRWPEHGPALMRYRGPDRPLYSWLKADSHEDAVARALEAHQDSLPEDEFERLDRRKAIVARLSEMQEVSLP